MNGANVVNLFYFNMKMTQYKKLDLELFNSKLNKFKSEINNGTQENFIKLL